MKFVLFRHAQKGILPFEDPELTSSGFEQSSNLLILLKEKALPTPNQIDVSPKRRTSQTLIPIARFVGVTPQVTELLDQRKDEESKNQFRNRVQQYLQQIDSLSKAENQKVTFACTHYDWLEEAMSLINCNKDLTSFEFSHWAPSQHLIFDVENTNWKYIGKGIAK
jgi:phosphohistidine phosphatase SixA